jgi:hypothetical protein
LATSRAGHKDQDGSRNSRSISGDTGNVEAQHRATLIINPTSLSAGEIDKLTRSTTGVQVAEWLNNHVAAQLPE